MSKPSPADLTTLSIAEAGSLMARGEITSTALTEAFLARIEAVDHKIASFVTLTAERARIAAKQADMELSQGLSRGPLHGIPIALKDIYETEGVLTTGHSHLRADYVPAVDAETVRRLKAGGAVILGKLATHEFANGAMTPDQPFPAARNPWNTDYQPGGSSSGSGAAVAAALCMGAMGSDTGGSIRNPAGFCGTAGIKPTYGLVSRCGIFPLSFSFDTAGPLAWTVEDNALMLDVLAGYDPNDQASAKAPKVDYGAATQRPIKGMRIALARTWYEGEPDGRHGQGHGRGGARAARSGRRRRGSRLPRHLGLSHLRARHHHRRGARHPSPGSDRDAGEVRLHDAPPLPARRLPHRRAVSLGLRFRRKLQVDTRAAMRGYDLIMAPNQWGPPETFEEPQAIFHFLGKASLSMPFNVTGQPALTVCCGFGSDGFPLAFQLAGRPFDEASVFAAGAAYERATPWRLRRPTL